MALVEVRLAESSPTAGRPLYELRLPPDAAIVAVIREGHVVIPQPETVLAAGDEVVPQALIRPQDYDGADGADGSGQWWIASDLDEAAVLEHQRVAAAQHHRFRQVEQEGAAGQPLGEGGWRARRQQPAVLQRYLGV